MGTILRQGLVDAMFQNIAEANTINHTKIFPMAAIWMEKPIRTSRERKVRLTENDLIYVENGEIKDCEGLPTHRIVKCEGTLANNILSFYLENLETKEIEKLELNK